MATTSSGATMPERQSSALSRLPNELLCNVAQSLTILELRQLGRTSTRFKGFIDDYLRYRYTSALFRLPVKVLKKIAVYLSRATYRSRFARVSQKLYPTLMEILVRHDISAAKSQCLIEVAHLNNTKMVRKIMFLGGNVNAQRVPSARYMQPTPLANAAWHGNDNMVHLFLKAGAKQFTYGLRLPLACAIESGCEATACILSAGAKEDEILVEHRSRERDRSTFLYMICEARFVDLTRQVLEHGEQKQKTKKSMKSRSIALHGLLATTACRSEFVEREILEDVYQITMLLLNHGANPDLKLSEQESRHTFSKTARELGSRCADPRVRNLLLGVRAMPLAKSAKSSLKVGRLMSRPDPPVHNSYTPLGEEPSADEDYSISLWDFVKKPLGQTPMTEDESLPEVSDTVGASK